MAGKIRVRAELGDDGVTEVKALMRHPMETGQRKDEQGQTIPAHFITEVTATLGDRVLMQCHWGPAVSQNPFLGFRFRGGSLDEVVKISWTDNRGETGAGEAAIR